MASVSVLLVLSLATAGFASAASPVEQAQMAELDRVRAEVANQVQLAAYDLVDELIYGWTTEPPFGAPTPVVLASVTVPVGLGTGLQALLENHIMDVVLKNPTSHVTLVHCPTCTAVVVHSGPEGTVVSRGIDDPKALEQLGDTTGRHALFVDVEAEGTFLVLRARLTELTPDLPIVWSHTISTSANTPALLRESDHLKSADEARKEYVDALMDRGPLTVPVRFTLRSYSQPDGLEGVAPPPFVWLQTGVELGSTRARRWTSSVLVGFSFIPEAYQGLMAQARVSRLLSGRVRSQTRPDLYFFVGAATITVWGSATAPFQDEQVTADDIITVLEGDEPRSSFGTLHTGLEVRVMNRIGMSWFLETIPSLGDSPNLGDYLNIFSLGFQSMGTEVTFCF